MRSASLASSFGDAAEPLGRNDSRQNGGYIIFGFGLELLLACLPHQRNERARIWTKRSVLSPSTPGQRLRMMTLQNLRDCVLVLGTFENAVACEQTE